jgi:hypothetical protein
MLALCIFPYAAAPLLNLILFDNRDEAVKRFRDERKKK